MAKAYANRGFVLERSVPRRDGGAAIMPPRLGVGKFGTCAERHYDIGVRYITLNDDYFVNSCMLFDFLSLNNELQLLNPLDDTDSFSGHDDNGEPVYLNHLCVAKMNRAHANDGDGRLVELEACDHFDREFTDVQFLATSVNDAHYAGMSVVEGYTRANDASITTDAIVAVVQGCDHYIAQDVALSAGVVIGGRYTLTYRVAIRPGMNDAYALSSPSTLRAYLEYSLADGL
ncbi:hypothetical protein CYMTET_8060 [Cymbomonas tetramitiformis]|uniref:Uncharacterized protein n=1 Tax=Cymbomonas tetramitiformis TaxID=36881 RepID=A0AAE0GU06_9CHLO|nr:hypothetical protein CYMTET_8060 [Cymbomonas tetramitiformis]